MALSIDKRNERIVARRKAGESLPSIGKRFNLTATRVWQLTRRKRTAKS